MPYKTTEQAYAVARSMGCNKIHKMPDGSYMPCGSHSEYQRMKSNGINKKSYQISLPIENALRRKMRSHNGRHGNDKKARATLGALKLVYKKGIATHKPGRAQSPEKWAMAKVNAYLSSLAPSLEKSDRQDPSGPATGHTWANKILRTQIRISKKMNNIFTLKELCAGMYPVKVANDLYEKAHAGSWSELAMLVKKSDDYSWVYTSDDEEICRFDKNQEIVLKVDARKDHSILPGKHKYTLVDADGKTVETGWLDEEFRVSDHVTSEDQAPTESAKIISLTDEDREIDSIADTIADDITTKKFFKALVDNKVEGGASIVFLSLMPTLDEIRSGSCLCGSIEKNLLEQTIDPIGVSADQVSFVNIVPFEVTDDSGKRSAPEKGDVEEWRPLVDQALAAADTNAIVVALGKDVAAHYADVVDFVMPHPFSKSKYSLPRKVEELKKAYEKKFDRQVKITKSDIDRRLVYGVVLEPEVIDAHNDVVSIDEIENAAHNYLIKSRMIGDQHNKPAKADIVESYIAPADLDIGGQHIKKGSWVMVTKVHDDRMWTGIKKGSYTGYSIGGYAVKEPLEDVGRLAQ